MGYRSGAKGSGYGQKRRSRSVSGSGVKAAKKKADSPTMKLITKIQQYDMRTRKIPTVKLVFEFGEKKEFNVENDLVETDQYGHLEVSLDSFLMSFVGVEEDDTIEEAMTKTKKYLLEHDIQVIGNPADETYDNHGNLRSS